MKITVLIGPDAAPGRTTISGMLAAWSAANGHTVQINDITSEPDVAALIDTLATADGVVIECSQAALGAVAKLPRDLSRRIVAADVAQTARFEGTEASENARVIWGRGIETFRWAIHALANSLRAPAIRQPYGSLPDQFAELRRPQTEGPHPAIVLIHGGFWRSHWELDLMDDLAIDLTERGYVTWNLEYRRGPGSANAAMSDIAEGIDQLGELIDLVDLDRIAVVGHSAGGHLAMLVAGRTGGRVTPALCVGLAPVANLTECATRALGDGAAGEFMGGDPVSLPAEYRDSDPSTIPHRRAERIALVQGLADSLDLIDFSRRYVDANPDAELIEVSDANHFDVIDPTAEAWRRAEEVIATRL